MNYKNKLVEYFRDSKRLTQSRYESSKTMFIYLCLIFFLNYFFVGARFYDQIFVKTLPFTYVTFLVAIVFFVFFYFKSKFELNAIYSFALGVLLFAIGLVLLIPFLDLNYNF